MVSFTDNCRLIGGVIVYFILRHDDPKKTKKYLYIGISMAIVWITANILAFTQIPRLVPDFSVNV